MGDVVSVPAKVFDGKVPGSFSKQNPERCFGRVQAKSKNGLVDVLWDVGGKVQPVKMKDVKREAQKHTVASILVLLVEGEQVAFCNNDDKVLPKNFFEVLVKPNWRKWVEAVKKELTGWDENDAVTVVNCSDVPKTAKVVPLGELYTVKRDGRYKYRQYLMGNLLREGVDYKETFSATVSGSGICTFYSIATTCKQEVWGWDAVCGYLQVKEQYDVYAFLPSHHEFSSLEYEELGKLREDFLQLVEQEGPQGLKKFAAKHRRETRTNPRHVLRCNSSVYGGPGCGHEFEMLIHAVHTKTCGCTQTQPEPSIFVRIVVDKDDLVVGYLFAAAFVDDLRFFGTEPERLKYMKDVQSKVKVTFEKPPVTEFVAIETYQDFECNTGELKMPRYWQKAAEGFKDFFAAGMKARNVPITAYDEKILLEDPTEEEIKDGSNLPFREILGVMSFPSSCCKYEIKYAVSVIGSRRGGWSKKHFAVLLKAFEYGFHTRELGLIYSKGLDPHGENTLYAYADASLKIPRPHGCRITMMNGAAISLESKKHTVTAPSSCHAEVRELYHCGVRVKGIRNLLSEMGMHQQRPTVVYQDNESAVRIANNRGSLGITSRSMSLDTLTIRNMVEDHELQTKWKSTGLMVGDMGTKALAEGLFTLFRDVMNGYGLVRAAYPSKDLPDCVYKGDVTEITTALVSLQIKITEMGGYLPLDDL